MNLFLLTFSSCMSCGTETQSARGAAESAVTVTDGAAGPGRRGDTGGDVRVPAGPRVTVRRSDQLSPGPRQAAGPLGAP